MDIKTIKKSVCGCGMTINTAECQSDLCPLSTGDAYFTLTTAFTKLVLEGGKERCNYSVSEIPAAVSLSVRPAIPSHTRASLE